VSPELGLFPPCPKAIGNYARKGLDKSVELAIDAAEAGFDSVEARFNSAHSRADLVDLGLQAFQPERVLVLSAFGGITAP
jgi:hypothetical protein